MKTVEVDIFMSLPGMIQAMANMAMAMPQNRIWLPKIRLRAAGLEATPRAQKADTRRPMNMRRYTLFNIELVWATALLLP